MSVKEIPISVRADTVDDTQDMPFSSLKSSYTLSEEMHRIGSTLSVTMSGLRLDNESACAIVIADKKTYSASSSSCDILDRPFPATCLVKAFTGTMVGRAILDGQVRLEDSVVDVLGMQVPAAERGGPLSRIHVRHLLTHTDGLDDCLADLPALSATGRIDVGSLCSDALAHPPLFSAGALYRYSDCGPRFGAAILEYTLGLRYIDILESTLLEPVGVRRRPLQAATFCPSRGKGLELSANDLSKVATSMLFDDPTHGPFARKLCALASSCGYIHPPWPIAQGDGVTLGWNDYGRGGLGHQGYTPTSSAAVRIFPKSSCAIVVTSTHRLGARVVFDRVFGRITNRPAVSSEILPRRLSDIALAELDVSLYCGEYVNRQYRIVISSIDEPTPLLARVYRRVDGHFHESLVSEARLVASTGHAFFPAAGPSNVLSTLLFSDDRGGSGFRVLNTGRLIVVRELR